MTLADLDAAKGEQVVADIVGNGGTAQFVRCDIPLDDDVRALVAAAQSAYGRLDGAFNNAGVSAYSHRPGNSPTLFADLDPAELRRTHEVNLFGTFSCMRHEIAAMLAAGGGAIVNTSSDAGAVTIAAAADYVSSKHAVLGLTKSAAPDYATQNIRVNAVIPGVTRTGMLNASFDQDPRLWQWAAEVQPTKRIAEPSEIAEGAVWLLSDAASFVTGTALAVDGGYLMT